jgi:SpoVK/Ycf46/Vps4 family AAA+-type ATPase
VDFNRIKSNKLVGRNIQRPLEITSLVTDSIKMGKSTALRNLIYCGAPSTGKTDLATYAAFLSGIQAFMLNSPKSGIVGESERKTRLMLNLLKEQHGVGIIDELELVLPMNRNIQSGDGGVTQNLMGQLQSFLSDSSLSGKVALIATSNKPGSISDAMLSRWVVVPVLMPLKRDYPAILVSIVKGVNPEFQAEQFKEDILQAAESFFYSGASPREIRESIIASMAVIPNELSVEHIQYASKDKIATGNRLSYIHSDLMAIKFCSNYSFLPWWNIKTNSPDPDYPYPDYIMEVLDESLMINREKLDKYIKEIEPYSNV